ncbi:MAG TPA: gluconate 2-dehydrogenase subunit 3 family protein [Actinomycetota bacterium]|nr:gluconate 2-dehydrogenase subunit 3 family protein [Actinomycetota bacterium]
MPVTRVDLRHDYVLNHCTRYLARDSTDPRHDFGQYAAGDARATVCEAWRFPIVDSYFDADAPDRGYGFNTVTFVYGGRKDPPPAKVELVGTFAELYAPIPLEPVRFLDDDTGWFAVSVRVPKGQVHRYLFRVDGTWTEDPVNPQQVTGETGRVWSRFFTDACQVPLVLTRRERDILDRLVAHLLPFRLDENRAFVQQVYNSLDRNARFQQFPLAYRLDEEVGVVNYIDKLLARTEQHNADDYHTCLALVDGILRSRYGGLDPLMLPPDAYKDLYDEMATNSVAGWDTARYADPRFFLLLLRRHAMTGAFVHPKAGGNSGSVGWMYLESRFRDEQDETLFDWRRAIEAPLGHNTDYRG